MHRSIKCALLAVLLASVEAFCATLQNGDFGSGSLTGWAATGNASVQNLLAGPTPSGNPYQALLGNASVLGLYALRSRTRLRPWARSRPLSGWRLVR